MSRLFYMLKGINSSEEKKVFICGMCGREYLTDNSFLKGSNTKIYAYQNYMLPICKNCVEKLYEDFKDKYKDEYFAIKRMCMLFDIYYNEGLVSSTISRKRTKMTTFTYYLSQTKLKQFKNNTFDTYLEECIKNKIEAESFYVQNNAEEKELSINHDVIDRWGYGHEEEDYPILEKEYDDWKKEIGDEQKVTKEIIIKLCINKLKTSKTDDAKELNLLSKEFSDLTKAANLQPKQNNSSLINEEKTLGQFFEEFEKNKYCVVDKKYVDIDGIKKSCRVEFKGGLALGMGIKSNSLVTQEVIDELEKYSVYKPENELLNGEDIGDDLDEFFDE